jgi:cytochrome c biogenesis protein CcdA
MSVEVTLLAAFGAGIVSILSPCILPLLPALLASSTGKDRLRPLAIVMGVIISFTIMGIISSAFGTAFRAHVDELKILAELLILLMGFSLLLDRGLFNSFSKFPLLAGMNAEGPVSGFLLGLSLGVLWIPCIGSILGMILTKIALDATNGSFANGAIILSSYSLGFALPMLVIAYSAHISSSKLQLITKYDAVIKKGAGIILILVGLWMVYQNHLQLMFYS